MVSQSTDSPQPPWRRGVVLVYLLIVGVMLSWISAYHVDGFGFTYLIGKGEGTGAPLDWQAKWGVDVYDHAREPGYDAQYYAQLALDPLLRDADLAQTVDNLPYRARRILLPWVAWVAGAGRPAWVIQVFSLLNTACWLGLGVVLLRWFPPTDWDRAVRWTGVMFSTGVCLSLNYSLVDGPSLLLLALALRWWEQGYRVPGVVGLAFAGLAKETNLLAGGLLAPEDWRKPRGWLSTLGRLVLVAVPLAGWLLWLQWRLGPAEQPLGARNFAWPFVAIWGRGRELIELWRVGEVIQVYWFASLAGLLSLLVQGSYLLGRWQWRRAAWRATAPFALLMLVIGPAVWEGSPGAAERVLLPMLLGFNLLLPRGGGRRWLLLLAGNLTLWFGPMMLRPVPTPVVEVVLPPTMTEARTADAPLIEVLFPEPWQALEAHRELNWRWAGADAEIVMINQGETPLAVTLEGRWASAFEREARLELGDAVLWRDALTKRPVDWRVAGVILAPGENRFRVTSDRAPAQPAGEGGRTFAVMLLRLRIVVSDEP